RTFNGRLARAAAPPAETTRPFGMAAPHSEVSPLALADLGRIGTEMDKPARLYRLVLLQRLLAKLHAVSRNAVHPGKLMGTGQRAELVVVVLEPRQPGLRIVGSCGRLPGHGLPGRGLPLRTIEDV